MLSCPEPSDVMKEWQPHVLLQYCADNCIEIQEEDAYELVQQFKHCPIKEFQNAGPNAKEPILICILRNECKKLFQNGTLRKNDFLPIQIAFESEDPMELPITQEIFGENEYCEAFNEVLINFFKK